MIESKIFERICGECIFIGFAFIFYFLISHTNNYKKIKKYLFFYVIILTTLSYLFKPFCTIDLTNQQQHILMYYNYTWNQVFELMFQTTDYARFIYFYIINRLGDVNLLQTFVTTAVYSIIFYTIYDYGKRNNYSGKCMGRTLFLFMMCGQYIDLISGIRSTTAYALLYFAFYRELIQQKSIFANFIFYFLAIGFHISVVPVILVRLLFIVFQKEKNVWKKMFNFTLFGMIAFVSFRYGGFILEAVSAKANNYLSKTVYSTINGYIISGATFIILIYIYFYLKKKLGKEVKKNIILYNYMRFCKPFFLIIILFSFEYSIFHRYIILLSMICIPLFITSFEYLSKENLNKNFMIISKNNTVYYILLLIMSFFSFVTGDMKLLQFFN